MLRPFLEDAAGAELAQLGPCLGDFLADAAFELFRKPQLLGPKHYAIVKEVVGDPGSLCADDRVIAEEVVAAVLGQILPQQAAGTLLRALRERTSGSGSERAGAAALARPPQPHPTRSPAAQPPAPLPPASPPPAAPRQALGPRLPPAPLPPRAAPPVEPIAPSEPPSRPRPALDWAVVTLPGRGSRLPPIEWIPVPAGETIVGSSKKTALAAAALDCSVTVDSRTVRVPAFEIARYTTTNEDYATFVRATRHSAPPHWATAPAAPYPPGLAQLPVVNVDRSDAEAYARWVGGRLPTIEEWTRASYGDDDRLYPWGDEYDGHERCNSSERTVLTSVDAHPEGASPYGCLNMCGNVFEWVEGERPRSARGGSCAQPCRIVGLTFLEVDIPEDEDSQVGFRLAADSSMPEGEAKARGLVGIGGGPFVRGAPPDIFERLGERVRVGGDLREGILRHARETASLPSFFIGRTAVTNADFLRYVEETGAHRPPGWQPGDTPFSPGQALFPVCGVPKAEARAYCAWAGGRLPTGLEWEKAARGTGGRIYPWGDEYDVARCNEAASVTLAPVEMFPTGRGPFGLLQSVGNVHEWTATIERTGYALTGGGSCKKSCQRFSLRGVWPQFALDARQNDLGFRVARDRRTS